MTVSATWATIRKGAGPGGVRPNVVDYAAARAAFSWDDARRALDGLPGGRGLNIAHEAVDRHARGLPLEAAEAHPATAQMMIVNPLSGGGVRGLFSTHPATEERIRRLLGMA